MIAALVLVEKDEPNWLSPSGAFFCLRLGRSFFGGASSWLGRKFLTGNSSPLLHYGTPIVGDPVSWFCLSVGRYGFSFQFCLNE